MKVLAGVLISVIFFCCNVGAKSKKSKSVTTLLEAKWQPTPLVLEVAEYLADENVDCYWNFIDSISSLNPSLNSVGMRYSRQY